jgi:hypothetical protein
MSKMASHCPFGHLQPKLWAKEGPGVKLPVWLPTTKSWESTSSRRRLKQCNIRLERSRRELQLWFGARPDPSSGRETMAVQSPGISTRDSFGTPTWESWEKEPFRCSLRGETQRILYGEGGGFPRVRAVVSLVCKSARGLSQHPRVFPNVN